jgi:hypothetical protein
MTGSGIHAWVLPLIGGRSDFAYQEIATMLEMIHVLGNSYRLASSGLVSSVLYGRFALGFCKALVIGAVGNIASHRIAWASPPPCACNTSDVERCGLRTMERYL